MICPFSNQTCTVDCPLAVIRDSRINVSCGVTAIVGALADIADVLRFNMLGIAPQWDWLMYPTIDIPDPEEDASAPEGERGQDGPDATGATDGRETGGGEAL